MKKNYEIAFLIREGSSVDATIGRIKEQMEKHHIDFIAESNMGVRNLAYSIVKVREKFFKAFYYFAKVSTLPVEFPEFDRVLRYDADIIRFMITKI